MPYDDDHVELEHESYVQVRFGRRSGGARRLYGSPLRGHGDTITLTVVRSKEIHELGRSWYFGRKQLIEIEMSAAQFAELLTTMNVGDGVPATLRRLQGERMEDPPEDRDLEHERVMKSLDEDGKYAREIDGHLRGAIQELEQTLERKSIRKVDVRNALYRVQAARREVSANLPYVLTSFREAAEKVKTSVMAEADAWLTAAVQRAGFKVLRNGETPDPPQIITSSSEPPLITSDESDR